MRRRIIEVYFDGLCPPYNLGVIASNAYVIKNSNNKAKERKRTTIHYGLAAEPFSNEFSNNVLQNIQA